MICVHTFTTYPIARVSNIAGTDVASFGVVTRGIGMTWFIQTLIFVCQYVIEEDIYAGLYTIRYVHTYTCNTNDT